MRKRILVVDDDEMNLKRTRMILEKHYNAMPLMDGIETFRRMKESSVDMPVIFLTASGYEDDVRSAISLGAVNYLKKPFFPNELLKRVAMGLEEQ